MNKGMWKQGASVYVPHSRFHVEAFKQGTEQSRDKSDQFKYRPGKTWVQEKRRHTFILFCQAMGTLIVLKVGLNKRTRINLLKEVKTRRRTFILA